MNASDLFWAIFCNTLLAFLGVLLVFVTLVVLIRAIDPEGWQRALDETREAYEDAMEEERQKRRRKLWDDLHKPRG